MDKMAFIVYIIGSFMGSTVLMNTSRPGRLEFPSGRSNCCCKRLRSGTRLIGFSFATWFSSQLTPNQKSPITDIHQKNMPSAYGCLIRHMKNRTIATNLTNVNNLGGGGCP
ncbi:Os07g0551750 [Oryza sativa Japonica Group]|uniref:Os07g0551750 protein n=1 Tax=Oryza sativa subsp. japonica TaxID=39947 RepID=A0A0P0X7L5_ORYSJ|nr:hypothetical protein EE612_039925 [Oryza sativa]BAT02057.1 Os07g0551750 [Oryza sativa Japonica Group]